jgi:hypothetical protein
MSKLSFEDKLKKLSKVSPLLDETSLIQPSPKIQPLIQPSPKIQQLIQQSPKIQQQNTNLDEIYILKRLNGVYVSNPIGNVEDNINYIMEKNIGEDDGEYQIRWKLTRKIKDLNISNLTAIKLGYMIMKKLRYGVKYDDDVEIILEKIILQLASN